MIKLLIVDDSPLMRRVLTEVFEREGDFEIAVARDGMEALAQLHAFQPDVMTLDLQMPRMDGLACLDRIMIERPCPVVMLSSLTVEGADATMRALDLGAVDFIGKPGGAVSLAIDEFAPRLIETVRAASLCQVRRAHRLTERLRALRPTLTPATSSRIPVPRSASPQLPGLVIIGSSTGGPTALEAVLTRLPEDFPWPIVIAQHMPATFTGSLAQRLDGLCPLPVMEVVRPTPLAPGCVFIARGDADMMVSQRSAGLVVLPIPSSPAHRWHPSVDRLMTSAMQHVPAPRLIGVLMTGMGNDGAASMTALHQAGGQTIAEAEDTALIWGMPGELVKAGGAGAVVPLDRIAASLAALVAAR